MAEILDFKAAQGRGSAPELLKVGGRLTNLEYGRIRSHLTPDEVDALIRASGTVGRHRHRDRTLIFVGFRHGLRVSELIDLQWSQVDFKRAEMHVRRKKNGTPATHPIPGDELRALRRLRREYPDGPFLFCSERGGPLSRTAVNKLVGRAGRLASIPFSVTPHMLRHACGFALANKNVPTRNLQDYLGHRNISNTAVYTQLAGGAFKGFWD